MRHTIYKWFWAWDFEKEEKWLNKMSSIGLQLVGVGFRRYVFDDGIQGEFSYRMEMLGRFSTNPESISYIHFLEDAGIEHIGSINRWAYFRRKASEGSFDLFSDLDSRIKHLKKIITLMRCVYLINVWACFFNLNLFCVNTNYVNLVCSCLSALMCGLLLSGMIKVHKKINRLKKDRIMRE